MLTEKECDALAIRLWNRMTRQRRCKLLLDSAEFKGWIIDGWSRAIMRTLLKKRKGMHL